MGAVGVTHNDQGVELTRDEFTSASLHTLVAASATAGDLVKVAAGGSTLDTTNSPAVTGLTASGAVVFGSASSLDSDGLILGTVGSHSHGPTEFIHYLCNEQSGTAITDRTGHFPGTLAGTLAYSTTSLPGNVASALTLDGAANYITAGTINYANWNELTVAMWVRVASDGADATQVLAGNTSSVTAASGGWCLNYLGAGSNKIGMYYNNQTAACFASGDGFAKNAWIHVVGTVRREKFVRCVINGGAFMAETAVSGSPAFNESTLRATNIGTRGTAGLYFFDGDVADVRIYNRALAMSEIEALYNGGAGRKLPFEVASRLSSSTWSEVFDYQTGNPSNTYQFTSNDSRLVAGTPIRFRQNNVLYYALVSTAAAGTVSIAGAALSTSYPIQTLAVGAAGALDIDWFLLPGSYASGKSAGAILQGRTWLKGPSSLVGIIAKHTTNDTGGAQPRININIATAAVSTANTNNGPILSSSAWTPDATTPGTGNVAISTANYNAVLGSAIDLVLTVTGTNKDAVDLRVGAIWVLH